jgi:hypothetical protein
MHVASGADSKAAMALGTYLVVEEEDDLYGLFQPVRLYLLQPVNSPVDPPCYFESGTDSSGQTCFQRCWNAAAPDDVWVRSGTLTDNDGETVPVWDAWKLVAEERVEAARAYADEQIALHGQSTWKVRGSVLGFYQDFPEETGAAFDGDRALKSDGTETALYDDGWTAEPYSPSDFDTWHVISDNHEWYWLHGEWNQLDFQVDASLFEAVSNKTDSLDLDPDTASSAKYPSEKAVASALTGLTGEIPDVSGKQDKIPAGPGLGVFATAVAGVVELRGVARATYVLDGDAAAGTEFQVPEYVIGSNRLMVFWDGFLAEPGEQYEETGSHGDASQTVTALAAMAAGTRLTFMVI